MTGWACGVAVLFNSHAQWSQKFHVPPKIKKEISSQISRPSLLYEHGLLARKKSVGVPMQLSIFPPHNISGAIDVLLLRIGCQQLREFVGIRGSTGNKYCAQ